MLSQGIHITVNISVLGRLLLCPILMVKSRVYIYSTKHTFITLKYIAKICKPMTEFEFASKLLKFRYDILLG